MNMSIPFRRMLPALFAASLLAPTGVKAEEQKPYTVVDGKVDKATYNGYRRFHGICHTCHGQDALGSTFAPSLVEALQSLSYDSFKETVVNGRSVTTGSGTPSVMPSFKENTDIMKYMDDIYAYLKARADGAIAGGRPAKIPN
jgi:mono/diheme cytochrome c family protein